MADHHEIERTWTPPPGAALPDLTALPGVASVGPVRVMSLDATYLDTADLALVRAGVSLRRRTGGADEGWHLKVPAGRGRDEIHRPLGASAKVPPSLAAAVQGWTRGAPLVPVATIATTRTAYDLLDAESDVLAELADDDVVASRVVAAGSVAVPVTWREWELELVGGRPKLLKAAGRLFARDAVVPSEVGRKIEVVLGDRLPEPPALPDPRPGKAASRLVHLRLAEQVARLQRRDSEVRRGSVEAVHRMRIVCRRLRGVLATYRPLLDREVTDPLREELRWVARSLGDSRDAHVQHQRLRVLVDAEPRDMVVGPVRRRLSTTYRSRAGAGRREAMDVLGSQRYLDLLAALEALVAAPPWTPDADRAARKLLPGLVRRDLRRLVKRYDALPDAVDRDAALHDVRRAAKRFRYAAEVLVPLWGDDAVRLARAAQQVTTTLGERQDTAVSRADLLEISREAGAAGENSFTYGRVHAAEQARALELEAAFEDDWADLSALTRAKKLRWLG